MTAHDLLSEPILSWRDAQRRRSRATLPGILARLASGELVDFPRVRAHQFHPWCMFLTQLAAIALRKASKNDARLSEDSWRSILLELTKGDIEPWCLVVGDLAKPGFLQPPVPEGDLTKWSQCRHPDDIDVLVTSKGHDVKTALVAKDDIEAWIYALVTLQTMEGYPGRGYNRISRMKGGYGSRPRVGLASNYSVASRFTRDIQVLLDSWDGLVGTRGFRDDGLALVWTAPWNGTIALAISELTPHFIEVCWRIRCLGESGGIVCLYTTTKQRRCLPEIEDGDAGDPWIPIERDEGALTVGRGGFHYELLTRLLFEGDFESAAAQRFRTGDADPMMLCTSVMARGQGKTEGLHEIALVLVGPVRKRLGHPDTRAALGKRATENVQQAEKMRRKVLFPGLKQLALGEKVVGDQFDARVNESFFNHLFRSLEQTDEEARLTWDGWLRTVAWAELQRAIDRCCVPSARRYRAISDAEGMFHGCLRRQFPTLVSISDGQARQGAV